MSLKGRTSLHEDDADDARPVKAPIRRPRLARGNGRGRFTAALVTGVVGLAGATAVVALREGVSEADPVPPPIDAALDCEAHPDADHAEAPIMTTHYDLHEAPAGQPAIGGRPSPREALDVLVQASRGDLDLRLEDFETSAGAEELGWIDYAELNEDGRPKRIARVVKNSVGLWVAGNTAGCAYDLWLEEQERVGGGQ